MLCFILEMQPVSKARIIKALPTHPLLIHKLLYTDHYDTDLCLYAFSCILAILNCEGRLFICAAATTSVNVCNSPHQSLLRELLIRHRRVLAGNEFYGSLAEGNFFKFSYYISLFEKYN